MWTLSEAKGLYVEFGFSSRWMMQKSAKGWEETLMRRVLIVGIIYMIKAFTWRFVLDAGKLRNFHNSVKNEATVDVHGCVITEPKVYLILLRYTDGVVYISAWASALLVRLNWAMRRPLSVGRVTVWTPTLFSYTRRNNLLTAIFGRLRRKCCCMRHFCLFSAHPTNPVE